MRVGGELGEIEQTIVNFEVSFMLYATADVVFAMRTNKFHFLFLFCRALEHLLPM